MVRYSMQSSANSRISDLMSAVMLFMYSKNSREPKTVPWGSPEVSVSQDDCDPFTTTRCSRFARNEEIQAKMFQ